MRPLETGRHDREQPLHERRVLLEEGEDHASRDAPRLPVHDSLRGVRVLRAAQHAGQAERVSGTKVLERHDPPGRAPPERSDLARPNDPELLGGLALEVEIVACGVGLKASLRADRCECPRVESAEEIGLLEKRLRHGEW